MPLSCPRRLLPPQHRGVGSERPANVAPLTIEIIFQSWPTRARTIQVRNPCKGGRPKVALPREGAPSAHARNPNRGKRGHRSSRRRLGDGGQGFEPSMQTAPWSLAHACSWTCQNSSPSCRRNGLCLRRQNRDRFHLDQKTCLGERRHTDRCARRQRRLTGEVRGAHVPVTRLVGGDVD